MEDTENDVIETEPTAQSAQKTDYDIFVSKMAQKLWANGQLILTGAPGTGKTHLAQDIAAWLILGNANKEPSKEELDNVRKELEDACRAVANKDATPGQQALASRFKLVQFHPGYSYSDFVEGLKPNKDNGFELRDGAFKEFCKTAEMAKEPTDSEQGCGAEPAKCPLSEYLINNFDSILDALCPKIGTPILIPFLGEGPTEKGLYRKDDTFYLGNPEIKITITNQTSWEKGTIQGSWGNVIKRNSDAINKKSGEELLNFLNQKFKGNVGNKEFFFEKNSINYAMVPVGIEMWQQENRRLQIKKTNPFVFIIDEINRADLSRVFGELMYGLEYRDTPIQTQYSYLWKGEDKVFKIPKNVYIIGTMNDIDRSVESMDFALRRRFAWQEISAYDSRHIFDGSKDKEIILKKMSAINQYIGPWPNDPTMEEAEKVTFVGPKDLMIKEGDKDRPVKQNLGKEYQLGGAYFKKIELYIKAGKPNWELLWQNHIEGILREYLRGRRDIEEILKALHDEYNPEPNS